MASVTSDFESHQLLDQILINTRLSSKLLQLLLDRLESMRTGTLLDPVIVAFEPVRSTLAVSSDEQFSEFSGFVNLEVQSDE